MWQSPLWSEQKKILEKKYGVPVDDNGNPIYPKEDIKQEQEPKIQPKPEIKLEIKSEPKPEPKPKPEKSSIKKIFKLAKKKGRK